MKKIISKLNTGFTLVETLVAISILTIAIMSAFAAVRVGLQSSSYAQDQVTAFFLAREATEYVRNVRDTNALEMQFNPDGVTTYYTGLPECTTGMCSIDVHAGTPVSPCNGNVVDGCTALNGQTTGTAGDGRFKRGIKIEQVNPLDNPDEHRVTVTVSYFAAGKTTVTTFTATSLLLDTQ